MTGQEIIYLLGDITLLTALPALGLFVGYYYFGSPWKTLLVGRSLMYFAVSLLVIIATVSLSLWWGTDYFLREWVRLFSYGIVSWTTWRLFITLRHIQKKGPVALEEIGLTDTSLTTAKPPFWKRRPHLDPKFKRSPQNENSEPEPDAHTDTGEVKTQ